MKTQSCLKVSGIKKIAAIVTGCSQLMVFFVWSIRLVAEVSVGCLSSESETRRLSRLMIP